MVVNCFKLFLDIHATFKIHATDFLNVFVVYVQFTESLNVTK